MDDKEVKEDKDALDALELEAKEFDKVRAPAQDPVTTANVPSGC